MSPNFARIEMPDLTKVGGEDQQICMMFNRAARDVRQDENVIRNAFDITLTRLGHKFDEDRIMFALMKGGLQAPSHMMPEKYEIYGSDVADGKERTAGHFHGALTGARAHPMDGPPVYALPDRTNFQALHLLAEPDGPETPPAYMVADRKGGQSGLAHLTLDM